MKTKIITLALITVGAWCGFSQGFVNLNFESATVVQDTSSPYYPNAYYAVNAIPGWTIGGDNGFGPNDVLYDNLSLGGAIVTLFDTNGWSSHVLDGTYSVSLYGGAGSTTGVSISQTGVVPASAVSLLFKAQPGIGTLVLSLDGQDLSYIALATASNYTLYGASIPVGLIGQSEQLEFFAQPGNNNYWTLDDIQFSSSPVPEPSALVLTALGGAALGWRRWRKS